jgi:hypothetical protein
VAAKASLSFTAPIVKLGINPCVVVPDRVVSALLKQAGREKGPVPVTGILCEVKLTANVVRYAGAWRLYLNTPMRRGAGVDVGDTARVSLTFDPVKRMPDMPPALKSALSASPPATAAWRLLPSSRRKEILLYINALKSDASRTRAVGRVMQMLLARAARR